MPQAGAALVGMLIPSLAGTVAASVIGSLLASVAMTALSQALAGQEEQPSSGIQTRTATAGDSTPQVLVFGTYATAGNHVCPPMTSGTAGGAPNGFMTYVMDVSDAPVGGLAGLWINDEKVEISPPGSGPKGYLYPDHHVVTTGQYADHVWVKFFDGTQTTAYTGGLSGAGGSSAGRPWTADMIGRNVAYAVVRFRYNDEVFRAVPTVLFEINGIGFYDPRRDSSVGGSGTHIWGNRATYEPSENPAVQVYNILRGIEMPDGSRWGGEAEAADLPLANWFAAMNECDLTVDGEPQYRTSTEVRVGPEYLGGQEPAAVIEELLRCCSGQVSEYGGVWKMRAGPVGMPVAVLTDEDIIISEEQRYDPFPGLQETYNAVHAQYPEPEEKWVSKEAPPRYNETWEAQDGGRRLVASLALGACPYPTQAQRLMRAYGEDERRHRRHVITVPPDYAALEPLDAVAWSSERNGYSAKVFEVGAAQVGARSLLARLSLRERDPADYDWQAGYELPSTVSSVTTPPIAPQAVPGWAVTPTTVKDESGTDRRAAVQLGWEPDQPDVRGVAYEVRSVGQTELAAQGSTQDVRAGGIIVVDGIIPAADMEARGRLVASRPTLWTSWTPFTAPDVRLGASDIAIDIAALFEEQGMEAIEYVNTLPATGRVDQLVFLRSDGKLYRWTGSVWESVVDTALEGALNETHFAQGISIPRVVASLPTTGNFVGRLVVLSSDGKLYRWTGSAWTAAVTAADISGQLADAQVAAVAASKITGQMTDAQIAAVAAAKVTGQLANTQLANIAASKVTGQLTDTQIAALAATKLTGQITTTQITDNAVTTAKVNAGAITAGEIAAGAVIADKVAANAITAAKIAAGAVETAKLDAGAITTDKLAANAVTTAKINAGAVTAGEIAAGAVVADKIGANAVTAVKISAGAVETAKLAAGAVNAEKIAAGAVIADKIGANAVTTDKLDANAVTAGKIAAGAIAADQIAAGAIVASKLAITDFTNLVPDNQLIDSNAWATSGGVGVFPSNTTSYRSIGRIVFNRAEMGTAPGTSSVAYTRDFFPVSPGDELFCSCQILRGGSTTHRTLGQILVYDKDSNHLQTLSFADVSDLSSYTPVEGIVAVTNAAAAKARFRFYVYNDPAITTANVYVAAPVARLRGTGKLIVDGTITGDKIEANTITGGLIAASGIITSAAQINNGVITTAKIADAQITSAKIGNLSVDTIKVKNGAFATATAVDYSLTSTSDYNTWVSRNIVVPAFSSESLFLVSVEAMVGSTNTAGSDIQNALCYINHNGVDKTVGSSQNHTPIMHNKTFTFRAVTGNNTFTLRTNGTFDGTVTVVEFKKVS